MSYCVDQILLLAGGLYTGIGSPTNLSVGYISGWITSSGNLGDINNRLTTCFYLSGDAPCITNGFGAEESSIYTLIFQSNYYMQRANSVLANGDAIPWTNMKEGDTSVTREGTVARAKAYLDFYKTADESLKVAVANWKTNHSIPTSIDGSDLYSWPSP